jgi:hypothetical protein
VPALTSTAADRRRRRLRKAARVLSFCVALVLGVAAALAVLFHYAGGWGVPYFSFTTERGSTCVNTFTGFRCDQLNLDDVRFFSGVDLPPSTHVVTSHYRSTHDYQLEAVLEVPPAGARAAQQALAETFGRCVQGHPSPLSGQRLTGVCVLANDTEVTESGVPDSRVFVVATGLRPDKSRVVSLSVRSR